MSFRACRTYCECRNRSHKFTVAYSANLPTLKLVTSLEKRLVTRSTICSLHGPCERARSSNARSAHGANRGKQPPVGYHQAKSTPAAEVQRKGRHITAEIGNVNHEIGRQITSISPDCPSHSRID